MIKEETKKLLDECSEFYLWILIEQTGGFLWRMNHDLADGRIDSTSGIEEDLVNMQGRITYAVGQTERFGLEDPIGKNGQEGKDAYWKWYNGWKEHNDSLTGSEMSEVGKILNADHTDPCSKFRPKGSTSDPDAPLERVEMLDLREDK